MALLKAAISRLPAGPFDPANLTLAHVAFVFLEFSQTRDAFANTFLLALSTASAGSLLALIVAYLFWLFSSPPANACASGKPIRSADSNNREGRIAAIRKVGAPNRLNFVLLV